MALMWFCVNESVLDWIGSVDESNCNCLELHTHPLIDEMTCLDKCWSHHNGKAGEMTWWKGRKNSLTQAWHWYGFVEMCLFLMPCSPSEIKLDWYFWRVQLCLPWITQPPMDEITYLDKSWSHNGNPGEMKWCKSRKIAFHKHYIDVVLQKCV